MDYFGNLVMFKNYNGRVVFSLLISSSIHDLLINLCVVLFFGPYFSALVGVSFTRRSSFAQCFFCASSSSS